MRTSAARAEAALHAEVAALRPQLLAAGETIAALEKELRDRIAQAEDGASHARRAAEAEGAASARADRARENAAVLEEEVMQVRQQLAGAQAAAGEAQTRLATAEAKLAAALAERDALAERLLHTVPPPPPLLLPLPVSLLYTHSLTPSGQEGAAGLAGASLASLESSLRAQKGALAAKERDCEQLEERLAAADAAHEDLLRANRKQARPLCAPRAPPRARRGAACDARGRARGQVLDADALQRAADKARNAILAERDAARAQASALWRCVRLVREEGARRVQLVREGGTRRVQLVREEGGGGRRARPG